MSRTAAQTAALVLMTAHCQDLMELRTWAPVGALVENVLEYAQHGTGSISERDARRLRLWSRRWCALDVRVREFYAQNADAPGVPSALWCVLDHRARPPGRTYGLLVKLWEHQLGYHTSIDLCPRIP